MRLETVAIKNPKGAGELVINASDYNPKVHVLASEPDPEPAPAKAAAKPEKKK